MPEKKEEAPSVMAQIPPSYRKLVSRTIQRELNVQFCILQEELRQDLAQIRSDGQESRAFAIWICVLHAQDRFKHRSKRRTKMFYVIHSAPAHS